MISILFWVLWRAVLRDRALLDEGISDAEIAGITRRSSPNILFYVVATLAAVVHPTAAAVLYLVIAVMSVLRRRGPPGARAPPTAADGRRVRGRP